MRIDFNDYNPDWVESRYENIQAYLRKYGPEVRKGLNSIGENPDAALFLLNHGDIWAEVQHGEEDFAMMFFILVNPGTPDEEEVCIASCDRDGKPVKRNHQYAQNAVHGFKRGLITEHEALYALATLGYYGSGLWDLIYSVSR